MAIKESINKVRDFLAVTIEKVMLGETGIVIVSSITRPSNAFYPVAPFMDRLDDLKDDGYFNFISNYLPKNL